MKKENIRICAVDPEGIAWEMGIEAGDCLISINRQPVKDLFDYKFLISDEFLEVLIEKPDGEQWLLEIEKEEEQDLGMAFENSLMDEVQSCRNNCIFCFIDQLPKGMRPSLYFKDDDSRLSFFQGNYVTLTNMSEEELDRLIYYHLSPINISIHTTDPQLRVAMLKNKHAGQILYYLHKFENTGIVVNGQIVLVPNVNDGKNLDKTISDLSQFTSIAGISVVPSGLTRFRDGLYPIKPYTQEECQVIIRQIEEFQRRFLQEKGRRFVYASDELYLKAKVNLPAYECYEGFGHLENGVGMIRLFEKEFMDALSEAAGDRVERKCWVVSGASAYQFINDLCLRFKSKYPKSQLCVVQAPNRFFGELITVSGLLTGQDILDTLLEVQADAPVLIPENALRAGEHIFLDDMTVEEISSLLQVQLIPVPVDGKGFFQALLETGRDKE